MLSSDLFFRISRTTTDSSDLLKRSQVCLVKMGDRLPIGALNSLSQRALQAGDGLMRREKTIIKKDWKLLNEMF